MIFKQKALESQNSNLNIYSHLPLIINVTYNQ